MPEPTSRKRGDVRPGAMTAAMRAARPMRHGPRHLRWARLEEGRVVEEEVRPPSRALTAGPGGDVEWGALDRARPLLVPRGETWALRVSPELRGKAAAGAVQQLAAGAPLGDDGWRELTLPRDARIRLELGDTVLLVQLVDEPPERKRAPLPAGLQNGVLEGTDWWFASFVACSFVLHFGIVSYLSQADFPIERALIPDDYIEAVTIFDDPDPPADDDVPVEDLDPDGEEVVEDGGEEIADNDAPPRPAPVRRDSSTTGNAEDTDPTISDDERAIAAGIAAVNDVIGGINGSMTQVIDDLEGGQDYGDAQAIMDQATHAATTDEEPGRLGIRGGSANPPPCGEGTGRSCIGDLARGGVATAQNEGGPVTEVVVRPPQVTMPGGPDIFHPPPNWDRRELVRALRSRMRAIQGCYERELTHGDPELAGRLTLSMTVMPAGLLAEVTAAENTTGSSGLAACAVRIVRGIRLRAAPPEPVDAEFPVVFARSN